MFGFVKLTKNADPDKYSYSGYGIGFDTRGYHSLPGGSVGKNLIFFELIWAHLFALIIKEKIMLILGNGPAHGLNHTLTAETQYSINFKTRYKVLFKPAL